AKAGDTGVYQTSEQVAQVVLEVAQSDNPPIRTRTSDWSNAFTHLKTASDPDGTKLVKEVIEKTMKS
ncbi:MAG: short-chain dehydrogenase/reductase, partial [Saprospiraceae bacterium]